MKKLAIALLAAVSAAAAAAGLAACDKSSGNYPNYINPDVTVSDTSNCYVIKTVSSGGLPLNGVKVYALKDGVILREGYSVDGKVEFALPLDNYTLEFSNLPEGYSASEDEYVTSDEIREFNAVFTSSVISSTAPSGTYYSIGDVMHDFTFTSYKGSGDGAKAFSSTLSSVLESKSAVILNFWYIGCSWCEVEFPMLDTAYKSYSEDVEVIALSPFDTVTKILEYKTQDRTTGNLDLPMGRDTAGLSTMFNVTGYPTTVVIDRYGVIAYVEDGAITTVKQWNDLIESFIGDDYTQNPGSSSSGGGSAENPDAERVLPTYTMPTNAEIQAVMNGAGVTASYHAEEDDDYSWPWIIEYDELSNRDCLISSNTGIDNSYAIIYADIEMKAGDALSYDYYYSTQLSADFLYVLVNDTIVDVYSGSGSAISAWRTRKAIYVADSDETIELAFCYFKDTETSSGEDVVKIANLTIENQNSLTTASDVRRAAAKNLAADGKSYTNYVEVGLNPNDNYYHVLDESGEPNGSILYMDMTGNNTPWVSAHCASDTFIASEDKGGYEYAVSFYTIIYWEYSDPDSETFSVIMNGNEYGQVIIDYYYMQMFSTNELVPVTEELRAAAEDFFIQYANDFNDVAPYENEWLELCYYYDHYGEEHDTCFKYDDPVKGMNKINAYEVFVNQPGEYNQIVVDKPLQINRGTYYRFTATQAGVYCFTSISSSADPYLFVRDADGNMLTYQDDDISNDVFNNETGNNFKYYKYMAEGEVIYLVCAFNGLGATGSYEMDVQYLGTEVWHFREATTLDGLWIGESIYDVTYGAIPVGFDSASGYFCHSLENGNFGSEIYVDFINPNYFDVNDNSLFDMIEAGLFGMYTSQMYEYYYQSIDKSADDITYGAVKADETLVNILNALVDDMQGGSVDNNGWLQFASYFAYYGPDGEWKAQDDNSIKV